VVTVATGGGRGLEPQWSARHLDALPMVLKAAILGHLPLAFAERGRSRGPLRHEWTEANVRLCGLWALANSGGAGVVCGASLTFREDVV
jgi:hypothetical protein